MSRVHAGWAIAFALSGLMSAGCPGNPLRGFFINDVSAPATDAEKREVRASDVAVVDQRPTRIGWNTVLRSGQLLGDATLGFGEQIDNEGKPILVADGSRPIADSNDFTSLLTVEGKLFSVAQFESQPGAMYLTELSSEPTTGKLTAVTTKPLDLSKIHGIWNPCAGVVTPWKTHLGSEEYEPDAKKGQTSAATMATFFGGGSLQGGDPAKPNPYFYGFPVEVTVKNADGDYAVTKHYSMGRFAHELSYVMPDNKTVYESDDGTNVGFYLYLADSEGDLTAGTLYAAKWKQTSEPGASALGTADIEFVKLGHASDTEIDALVATGLAFTDIFDAVAPSDTLTCPDGYKSVNANGVGLECLALKAGQEKAAAFLETRRYAGYLGATTEFRKEEGITFDAEGGKLYVSYSELQYGMENHKKNGADEASYDVGTNNDIKLKFNVCGAVYGYDVGTVAGIESEYVIKSAEGIVAGRMTQVADPMSIDPDSLPAYAEDSPFVNSTCDIDGIANPDNLTFIAGRRTLIIGEDSTDGHQNDVVWSYDLREKALTRILTTPYGAETTSVYYYPDFADSSYIVSVVQHPYGESDTDKLSDPAEKHSYFGVIGPLPTPRTPRAHDHGRYELP
jgi:secreted PhoX family phosphatase